MTLVFPAESVLYLLVVCVLTGPTCYTFYHVYYGSRSPFALMLLAFSGLYAILYLGMFITNLCGYQSANGLVQSFYAWWTIQYLFLLASIQTWLFAVHYLDSAIHCGTRLPIPYARVVRGERFVLTLFCASMLLCYIVLCCTFPGYSSGGSATAWDVYWQTTAANIIIATYVFYIIFNLISFSVLLYAMQQMTLFVKSLGSNSELSLGFNQTSLTVHQVVLFLYLCVDVLFSLFWLIDAEKAISEVARVLWILCTMSLQLVICYICYTMGSSVRLRGVKVLVQHNSDGVQIKFETSQSNLEFQNSVCESRYSIGSVNSDNATTGEDRKNYYKFLPGTYAESFESGYNEVVQQFFVLLSDDQA